MRLFGSLALSALFGLSGLSVAPGQAAEAFPAPDIAGRLDLPGSPDISGLLDGDRALDSIGERLNSESLSPEEQAELRGLRGDIFFGMGDCASAREELDAAIALNPENGETYALRAAMNLGCGADAGAAIADAENAVRLSPESAYAHYVLGTG